MIKLTFKRKTRSLLCLETMLTLFLLLFSFANITRIFMNEFIERTEFLKKIFQHSKIIVPIAFLLLSIAFIFINHTSKLEIEKEIKKENSSNAKDKDFKKKIYHGEKSREVLLIFSIALLILLAITSLRELIPTNNENLENIATFLKQNKKALSIVTFSFEGLIILSFLAMLLIDSYNQYQTIKKYIVNSNNNIEKSEFIEVISLNEGQGIVK